MKYKLLLTEPESFSTVAVRILSSFCDIDFAGPNKNDLLKTIPDYDILFIRLGVKFDQNLLNKGKKLKYIVSPTTGLDHIDLATAESLGIKILSLQGEAQFLQGVSATAELAWGLILSLLRNIPWSFDDVKKGNWSRDSFKGHELTSKRLGILGLGRLGEKVARYGIAFGMQVIAYDPYRIGWINGVDSAASLTQLLTNCDILSIHVPLNKETEEIIGEEELSLLPEGSWIVNTSRGKVINENALLNMLMSGHIGGAGLDVLIDESQGNDSVKCNKLIQYSKKNRNLIITPHIGGATFESMQKTEVFMAAKLKEVILMDNKTK